MAPGAIRRSLWHVTVGILIGVLLFAGITRLGRNGIWGHVARFVSGRSTQVDVSAPAVLDRIRRLSRLETVAFSMDKIVEGERESAYLPNFLVGEKLLLIAHGDVTAGVDLAELKPGDVWVHGDSVTVRLPQPQILSTRIDNARTRIYSRTTGVLVTADPNLETQVRQAAEDQITKSALADGILDRAGENARSNVSALLAGLGFKKVDVR